MFEKEKKITDEMMRFRKHPALHLGKLACNIQFACTG